MIASHVIKFYSCTYTPHLFLCVFSRSLHYIMTMTSHSMFAHKFSLILTPTPMWIQNRIGWPIKIKPPRKNTIANIIRKKYNHRHISVRQFICKLIILFVFCGVWRMHREGCYCWEVVFNTSKTIFTFAVSARGWENAASFSLSVDGDNFPLCRHCIASMERGFNETIQKGKMKRKMTNSRAVNAEGGWLLDTTWICWTRVLICRVGSFFIYRILPGEVFCLASEFFNSITIEHKFWWQFFSSMINERKFFSSLAVKHKFQSFYRLKFQNFIWFSSKNRRLWCKI